MKKGMNIISHKEEKNYENVVVPEQFTAVSALNLVLELAKGSALSEKFWETVRPAVDFLNQKLGLNDIQIVVLAIMIEEEGICWHSLGRYLGMTRLSAMSYSEDIEEMVDKGWLMHHPMRERGNLYEGYRLVRGVITDIRHDKPFVPENLGNLSLQEFIDLITKHLDRYIQQPGFSKIDNDLDWYRRLLNSNPQLELCQQINKFGNIYNKILFLVFLANYSLFADSESEGISIDFIRRIFPAEFETDFLESRLANGTHQFLKENYLEFVSIDGLADMEILRLHRRVKDEMLSEFKPSRLRCSKGKTTDNLLKSHQDISAKTLFYNPHEESQIERLSKLLHPENFRGVQTRLAEQGMRKGFACLFYGTPGTGKTESVLQLARTTGRDIMKIEVASLLDKFVGESEKNIQSVFSRYRELCKNCEVQPILFFNEADAIFGRRHENAPSSADKMRNTIQNILLQEMEDLDGILIATTNLTGSFDPAFERRFLFKIEFKNPEVNVKSRIWESMLGSGITSEEAEILAQAYDFSGGQIENIVRKQTVDYILEGRAASFEDLRRYCDEEKLNNKNTTSTVGFKTVI